MRARECRGDAWLKERVEREGRETDAGRRCGRTSLQNSRNACVDGAVGPRTWMSLACTQMYDAASLSVSARRSAKTPGAGLSGTAAGAVP